VAQRIVTRRRRWLLIAAAVVVLLVIALNILSGFYIDLLWFKEVGFQGVFWTVFWTKVVLGLLFGALFFGMLYANLLIVRRLIPPFRTFTPEQEVVERYRVAIEPYAKWILPALSLVIAVFVGLGASSQWQTFQLWRHSGGVEFGQTDPVYGRDIGFYVFQLPFLHFVQGWLFSALVGITILVAIAHYLWGGIRLQATSERVTPQVKAHLSVLLGLIVLVKAWGYYLGKFDLLFSKRGVVQGASYTDIHAQKLALSVLMVVAVICAIVFFVNIRFRGWAAPAVAVGLLAVVAVVVGAIIPAAVQRLSVAPQELQREEPFIQRNIAATRAAFGLDAIVPTDASPDPSLTPQDIEDNQATVQNIRLWDPDILKQNYDALQRIRSFYEFTDVDVDRYQVDDEQRVVMISAREVSQDGIPAGGRSWQNEHLVYTHGFGAVASQVNTSTSEGEPAFLVQDVPPKTDQPDFQLSDAGQRVYFGERSDVPFVVVNTGAGELDYQSGNQQQQAPVYTGRGGIQVGGVMGKLLFAWRFKDVNLLISGLIHNDSRVMIFRSLKERIPKPAPFLKYDSDPYAAVVDGRLVWIQDAYTTTNNYPYSQSVRLSDFSAGKLSGTANYIRNSVKVVVDAYSGQMTYYVVDPSDPIIRAWQAVFPDLFHPFTEAPEDLLAHFRYPEDLFTVQANQFTNYHVTDPRVFYGKQDFWALPGDPSFQIDKKNPQPRPDLRPYYVQMLLPGSDGSESFQLILPFTPTGRTNMVAWMAASSDPGNYGDLVSFEFPSGQNVDGPLQVFNQINSDPAFSAERTLLSRGGSRLVFGNFLVVPIDNGFLYVLPVFVQGSQPGVQSFPELKRVVVVQGSQVGLGPTLSAAIADSFGNAPPPPPPDGGNGGGTVPEQIKSLLADAVRHFQAADVALKAGDLGTYQSEIAAAQRDIEEAQALANGVEPEPTPTGTPTATPTETPSGTGGGSPPPTTTGATTGT
jgi:uncharacterized membrane protein (UPF0182 family)